MFFSKNAYRYRGSLAPHGSSPQTRNQSPRKLQRIRKSVSKQDFTPKEIFSAQDMGRRSILLAAPLLFLPVTGCSSGGFYDTGESITALFESDIAIVHISQLIRG